MIHALLLAGSYRGGDQVQLTSHAKGCARLGFVGVRRVYVPKMGIYQGTSVAESVFRPRVGLYMHTSCACCAFLIYISDAFLLRVLQNKPLIPQVVLVLAHGLTEELFKTHKVPVHISQL